MACSEPIALNISMDIGAVSLQVRGDEMGCALGVGSREWQNHTAQNRDPRVSPGPAGRY